MGLWSNIQDMKSVIAYEKSPHKVDIQEWDCFDTLVLEWKRYFEKECKDKKINPKCMKHGGDIFQSAMNLDGTTPPAKRSGGDCTVRAVELFNKYGGGKGPSFGAAMHEGFNLAQGNRSKYPTKSFPKGCLGK